MSKIQFHAYTLIALMGLALLGAKAVKPLAEGKVVTDFGHIPMEIGDWSGFNGEVDENTQRLLPSCSILVRYYDHSDVPPVEMTIVYGNNLGDFHQPEQCLEGQGLRSLKKATVQIKGADGKPFEANSVIMDSDYAGRRAFVYWFSSRGTTSTFLGNYKTKILFDRLISRKVEPSAMVRISTAVSGSDDDEAIKELIGFAGLIVPGLDKEFAQGTSLAK